MRGTDALTAVRRRGWGLMLALCLSLPVGAGAATRTFTLPGFQQISLEGPYSVEVRVGPGVAVRAEGARDDLEALNVAVQGDRLVIRQQRSTWSARDTDGPVTVRVSVPALAAARVTGAGDMAIDRIKAASFTGALLGAGKLDVAGIAAERITINAGGAGTIRLAGTARDARLVVQGASNVDATGLAVRNLDAVMQGAGTIRAQASETASLMLAGSGDIRVDGEAKCTVKRSGAGQVRCGR